MLTRMRTFWLIVAVAGPAPVLSHAAEPVGTLLKPSVVLTGTHSQVRQETLRLITTASEWKTLWKAHRGDDPHRGYTETHQELMVDFEAHFVVAIFTGACDWCDVKTVRRGDAAVVGFERCYTQTEGGPLGAGSKTPAEAEKREEEKESAKAPYAFVVLEKPLTKVVIEEGNGPTSPVRQSGSTE